MSLNVLAVFWNINDLTGYFSKRQIARTVQDHEEVNQQNIVICGIFSEINLNIDEGNWFESNWSLLKEQTEVLVWPWLLLVMQAYNAVSKRALSTMRVIKFILGETSYKRVCIIQCWIMFTITDLIHYTFWNKLLVCCFVFNCSSYHVDMRHALKLYGYLRSTLNKYTSSSWNIFMTNIKFKLCLSLILNLIIKIIKLTQNNYRNNRVKIYINFFKNLW